MKRIIVAILALVLCAVPLTALCAGDAKTWAYQGNVAYFVEDGKIGLLRKSGGRTMVAPILEEVHPFIKDMANVRMDGLWGLLDNNGHWVCRPLSIVPIDFGPDGELGLYSPEPGLWGFVNRQGEIILEPAAYADAGVMSAGLFAASDGNGYGYVTDEGKVAIGFQYDQALPFSETLAAVQKDGKWGYINKAGGTVLPLEYDSAGSFFGGLAPVTPNGETSTVYIDTTGKVCLTGDWDWGGDFTKDKLARVRLNGKYGYINPKGKLIISARYEDAHDFGDGAASVKNGDESWIFIDTKGKIISKSYVSAGPYVDGFAFVSYEEKGKEAVSGYINKKRFFVCYVVE